MSALMRLVTVMALGLLAQAALAQSGGWRWDGTATSATARPPSDFSRPTWRTPLATPANASPVHFGNLVLVTEEPTTLVAIDSATGAVRWSRTNDFVDVLDRTAAAPIREALAEVPAREAEVARLRARITELRLAQRRIGSTVTAADLSGVEAQLASAMSFLDGLRPYRTPPTGDIVGWASPTPTTDGTSVWALFANGVMSRYEKDGTRTWTRWLGLPVPVKRGYTGTDGASPAIADGVLLAPYGRLYGLDPGTGRTLWTGPVYTDFGSPAIARVGSLWVVLTPSGMALDLHTGAVLLSNLGNVLYSGPTVSGDRACWTGGTSTVDRVGDNLAACWRLSESQGTLRAERMWTRTLLWGTRIYTTPLVHNDRLYTSSKFGDVNVLDMRDGTVLRSLDLAGHGEIWANLVMAGDRLFITNTAGLLYDMPLSSVSAAPITHTIEPARATPLMVDKSVFLRSDTALLRYDAR